MRFQIWGTTQMRLGGVNPSLSGRIATLTLQTGDRQLVLSFGSAKAVAQLLEQILTLEYELSEGLVRDELISKLPIPF